MCNSRMDDENSGFYSVIANKIKNFFYEMVKNGYFQSQEFMPIYSICSSVKQKKLNRGYQCFQ